MSPLPLITGLAPSLASWTLWHVLVGPQLVTWDEHTGEVATWPR